MSNKKYNQKIVTIGGGTGQFHLLAGLRELNENESITAVAGTWDSGGSSGRLRTELGVLPPGDIRRCILALMPGEKQRMVAQTLFDDRLEDMTGPMKGHSFGNLLTARLENIYKGQDRGIDAERELFNVKANVMPVSITHVDLIAETSKGNKIIGETNIDTRVKDKDYDKSDRIVRIYFDTRADANLEVIKQIEEADKIVFSAGDLYTSILPHLLVDGVREVISRSKAKLIYILNLATKPGETDNYKASEFLKNFLFYLDIPGRLDYIVANDNHLEKEILDIYKGEGQNLVEVDEEKIKKMEPHAKIVKKPVSTYLRKEHLLRHNSKKLALAILEL
ncbi:YvcK family protein [Candidatus Microgenomates bacterium]|nr:YvcK family protein [Candidatus Microgenomates bacterium]